MTIEKCQRCVGYGSCDNEVVVECLPVPFFGDIVGRNLKVVTVGLNPALDEFYFDGIPKERSQRLALLGDYRVDARTDLGDADVADAKARRVKYFNDTKRDWHPYFEKMESVLNRVNPAWTYAMGSAVHIDLVACSTKIKWSRLTAETQSDLVENCREHFLTALSSLPNGTVILCDGVRATREIQNLDMKVEVKPTELINLRQQGDRGLIGDLFIGDRKFPVRGWSSQVSRLSAIWRYDLAFWLHETLFPKSTWVGNQALL
ncbi:MAG: hypothetical protein ABSA83_16985 [Verrucomicrobiota bacterium]|jgi:hypothetical protein